MEHPVARHRNVFHAGITLLVFALLSACSAAQSPEVPVIRVELDMSLEEFREAITFPFPDTPSLSGGRMSALTAQGPFGFEFIIGSDRMILDNIGPRNLDAFFTFFNENLDSLRIYPHSEGLTLEEAIHLAKELSDWCETASFETTTRYPVRRSQRREGLPTVTSLDDAHALLRDSSFMVADMVLYTGERDGVEVVLAISNGRRIRSDWNLADQPGGLGSVEQDRAALGRADWLVNLRIGLKLDAERIMSRENLEDIISREELERLLERD